MAVVKITKKSDLAELFTIPFIPRKVLCTNTSELYDEGDKILKVNQKQLAIYENEESFERGKVPQFRCDYARCTQHFTSVQAYEIHYRSTHANVCTECKKFFPSVELLDLHIQEKHDSFAQAKCATEYKCLIETCTDIFRTTTDRNEHLIKTHKYPSNFKYLDLKKAKLEKMDASSEAGSSNDVKPKINTKNVPPMICFGRHANRGFPHNFRKKTSLRKDKNTISTDITMRELGDALDS